MICDTFAKSSYRGMQLNVYFRESGKARCKPLGPEKLKKNQK